jgi:aryl-alcohol dehydrogenase-like predicted oxidoreductase
MKTNALGLLGQVSRLTLGGGGIGHIWGPSSREESIATIHAALDGGIDLIDTAPMYGSCEAIIGETFNGKLPAHVRITTKCYLGSPPAAEIEQRLVQSLDASLAAMKLKRVDVFFLHSNICEDDFVYAVRPDLRDSVATTWSLYTEHFIPAVEKLKAQGKIGMWAITGIGVPSTIQRALAHDPKPAIVQAITNLMDSAGALRRYAEPAAPRAIIAKAKENGVGVMGIRAVQAGALTAQIDRSLSANHPETKDHDRAAPYRELCKQLGQDPAVVSHRYALSMDGVDTVVLGVKNREELAQCLEGERLGPLSATEMKAIDDLRLRV